MRGRRSHMVEGRGNPKPKEVMRFLLIWTADSELRLASADPAVSMAARAAVVAIRHLQRRIREKVGGFLLCVPLPQEAEDRNEEELIGRVKRVLKAWVTNTTVLSSAEEPILLDIAGHLKSQPELPKQRETWHTPGMGGGRKKSDRKDQGRFTDGGLESVGFTGGARVEHLQNENKELRRERDEARAKLAEQQNEYKELRRERDEARAKLAEQQNENKELRRGRNEARAKLAEQQNENKELRRGRNEARVELAKQLSDFALLLQASRILGVDHTSILTAIKKGRLTAYKLADGRTVIYLPEARPLWPPGGYEEPGRPTKKALSRRS